MQGNGVPAVGIRVRVDDHRREGMGVKPYTNRLKQQSHPRGRFRSY